MQGIDALIRIGGEEEKPLITSNGKGLAMSATKSIENVRIRCTPAAGTDRTGRTAPARTRIAAAILAATMALTPLSAFAATATSNGDVQAEGFSSLRNACVRACQVAHGVASDWASGHCWGFTDADGDGICDNAGTGVCVGAGVDTGTGTGSGSGLGLGIGQGAGNGNRAAGGSQTGGGSLACGNAGYACGCTAGHGQGAGCCWGMGR